MYTEIEFALHCLTKKLERNIVSDIERGVVALAATNNRRRVGFERDPSTRLVPRLRFFRGNKTFRVRSFSVFWK